MFSRATYAFGRNFSRNPREDFPMTQVRTLVITGHGTNCEV
jgi:hypothetical protein